MIMLKYGRVVNEIACTLVTNKIDKRSIITTIKFTKLIALAVASNGRRKEKIIPTPNIISYVDR